MRVARGPGPSSVSPLSVETGVQGRRTTCRPQPRCSRGHQGVRRHVTQDACRQEGSEATTPSTGTSARSSVSKSWKSTVTRGIFQLLNAISDAVLEKYNCRRGSALLARRSRGLDSVSRADAEPCAQPQARPGGPGLRRGGDRGSGDWVWANASR